MTKALTVRQPWASLIACGAKTIETRSWKTSYRGDLLIHAGKAKPDPRLFRLYGAGANPIRWELGLMPSDPIPDLPLGAVVAVARLADVVPIVDASDQDSATNQTKVIVGFNNGASYLSRYPGGAFRCDDQVPLGDFMPGRYAWLLTDVVALADPIPAKGRQGLWTPDADLVQDLVLAPHVLQGNAR